MEIGDGDWRLEIIIWALRTRSGILYFEAAASHKQKTCGCSARAAAMPRWRNYSETREEFDQTRSVVLGSAGREREGQRTCRAEFSSGQGLSPLSCLAPPSLPSSSPLSGFGNLIILARVSDFCLPTQISTVAWKIRRNFTFLCHLSHFFFDSLDLHHGP